jgi:hypothetical protein
VSNLPKKKELISTSAVDSLAANLRGLKFNAITPQSSIDLSKAQVSKAEFTLFSDVKIVATVYKADDKDYIKLEASNSTDAAKQQSDEFNARWKGWLYEIPSYKADSFRKKMSDVMK